MCRQLSNSIRESTLYTLHNEM